MRLELSTGKYFAPFIILAVLLLASGCNGGGDSNRGVSLSPIMSDDEIEGDVNNDVVTLVAGHYPAASQTNVPLHAQLLIYTIASGDDLEVELKERDSGTVLPLDALPAQSDSRQYNHADFKPLTRYVVSVRTTNQSFEFSFTSAAGPASGGETSQPLLVSSDLEDNKETLTTASSFHFTFNNTLDRKSVNTTSVTLFRGTIPVPVNVFSVGASIAVDPVELLDSASDYTLRFSGINDIRGRTLATYSHTFTVQDIGILSPVITSVSTESLVTLSSNVLGPQETRMSGTLSAQLADPNMFAGLIPIVIEKGSLLSAESLSINLAGKIPTQQHTGRLYFQLLTDTIGILSRNDLLDDAPSTIRATFDLALVTEDAEINSFFSQQLLGVELVGLATLSAGSIEFSLSGSTALQILDNTPIVADISLKLASDLNATVSSRDSVPRLLGTLPADNRNQFPLGERLTLLFDRPMDPGSLLSGIKVLDADFYPVSYDQIYDGARVHLYPHKPWRASSQYTIRMLQPLSDLQGQLLTSWPDRHFRTVADPAEYIAPLTLLNVSPGMSCPLTNADYAGGYAGSCAGTNQPRLKIFEHETNELLRADFTTAIDPATVSTASSCNDQASVALYKVDWSGGQVRCLSAVEVSLTLADRSFTLLPDKPLQVGAMYQLKLHAGPDYMCDQGELCGVDGYPLNTEFDSKGYHDGGGPDIAIPFLVVARDERSTLINLSTRYHTDTNGNGVTDGSEEQNKLASIAMKIDLCDTNFCSKPGGVLAAPVCDGPGDMSPSDSRYSCNADTPRTQLGLLGGTGVRFSNEGISYMHTITRIRLREAVSGHRIYGDFIPVTVEPMLNVSSSLSLLINALIDIPVLTGPLAMQVFPVENPEFPGTHAWINNDDSGQAIFNLPVEILVSAPFLEVPTGGSHDLYHRKLSVVMYSPVKINESGDIIVTLRNRKNEKLVVSISDTLLGAADGTIVLDLPPDNVVLRLYGRQMASLLKEL